jgi:hypothetical protein
MTMKVKVLIFSNAAAVAAVSATLMIIAATHGSTDLVFAQGAAKFGLTLQVVKKSLQFKPMQQAWPRFQHIL